jgi:hypothetical protein
MSLSVVGTAQAAVAASVEGNTLFCGYSSTNEPLYRTSLVTWTMPSGRALDNWYVGEGTTGDGDYFREELSSAKNQSQLFQSITVDNSACLTTARVYVYYLGGHGSGVITYDIAPGDVGTITRFDVLRDTGGYRLLIGIGEGGV